MNRFMTKLSYEVMVLLKHGKGIVWRSRNELYMLLRACHDAGLTWNESQDISSYTPWSAYGVIVQEFPGTEMIAWSSTYGRGNNVEFSSLVGETLVFRL